MFEWRKYQKEVYETIIDNADKYDNFLVDAPTGFGKSIVNYMVAKHFKSAWYATPQLVLLDQLQNDKLIQKLGGITIIKGKQNYKCLLKNVPIDVAPCISRDFDCPVKYKCPWEVAKRKALSSPITGLSFSMLLLTAGLEGWGRRKLLIVDEGDDIEGWAVDQLGTLRFRIMGSPTTIEEVIKWAKVRLAKAEREKYRLESKGFLNPTEAVRLREVNELIRKLDFFLEDAIENPDNWAFRLRGKIIELKVLNAGYILRRFLWWRGEKRLVSSATIIDPEKFAKYTGLTGKTLYIKVPHVIPKERRPIIYRPIAKMTKDNRDEKVYKEVAQAIEEIAQEHRGTNGIIHAHSYEIAHEIAKRLKLEGFKVIVHRSDDRDRRFEEFLRSKNAVFIAVGFSRGIDLKYDLARWQVITKIPYPDQSDIRVWELWVKRKQWAWARYQAVKNLVQMVGRIVRAPDDYGVTYILDKSLEGLLKYKNELPEWFREAIIREDELPQRDLMDILEGIIQKRQK